jgi:hypothetical protein
MSRFASLKTAQIWVERLAKGERFNAPVAPFCQSIGCSPMTYTSGNVNSLLSPKPSSFCVCKPLKPTEDSIEIKLSEAGERPEARGVREQPNSQKTLVRSSAGIQ